MVSTIVGHQNKCHQNRMTRDCRLIRLKDARCLSEHDYCPSTNYLVSLYYCLSASHLCLDRGLAVTARQYACNLPELRISMSTRQDSVSTFSGQGAVLSHTIPKIMIALSSSYVGNLRRFASGRPSTYLLELSNSTIWPIVEEACHRRMESA